VFRFSIGPLKGLRFRFAKTRPGDGGGAVPKAAPPSERGARTTRILEGKLEDVGVAGSTFTEECGERCFEPETDTAGEAMEAEEVEDAFEWEWWWCGMERMEDIDEEVDLRPRRPPEERR
jgi:hypothetical protein